MSEITLANNLEKAINNAVGDLIDSTLRRKIEEAKEELDKELSKEVAGIALQLQKAVEVESYGEKIIIKVVKP